MSLLRAWLGDKHILRVVWRAWGAAPTNTVDGYQADTLSGAVWGGFWSPEPVECVRARLCLAALRFVALALRVGWLGLARVTGVGDRPYPRVNLSKRDGARHVGLRYCASVFWRW